MKPHPVAPWEFDHEEWAYDEWLERMLKAADSEADVPCGAQHISQEAAAA